MFEWRKAYLEGSSVAYGANETVPQLISFKRPRERRFAGHYLCSWSKSGLNMATERSGRGLKLMGFKLTISVCTSGAQRGPVTTPVASQQSIDMAESFAKTFKRDYAKLVRMTDSKTVMA